MECCYPIDCGEYAVAPMLVPAYCTRKYCEPDPPYYPRLPRCSKPTYSCCPEQKPQKCRTYDCCDPRPQKECHSPPSPPAPRRMPCPEMSHSCDSCCYHPPPCKQVKTKYIMPCYRYEDGRITNQPTVLMRRACEVACGTRKRKPFVVSSYAADPHNEIRRFHSEDERGNCCYHFERKKPKSEPCWAPDPCELSCQLYPACVHQTYPAYQPCPECQYVDCVYAHPVDPASCCHFTK